MALTFTEQIELGYKAPDFKLSEPLTGKKVSLDDIPTGLGTVIMFICNHCPYVKHVNAELVKLANDYLPKGISFVAINSNDVETYPDDSPENMIKTAQDLKYPFPYLFDESQEIAKKYHAVCTPDFSIFDENRNCIYRGQLDDSRPGNEIPVSGKDIRAVLDALIYKLPIPKNQNPSAGCSIKWK